MPSDTQSAPVDILDLLLSAPPAAEAAVPSELDRLIRRAVAQRPATRLAPPPPAPDAPRAGLARKGPKTQGKIKTTQYLTPDTRDRLSRVRDSLTEAAHAQGGRRRGRVSKSRIVETALRQALADFETRGPASRLARALKTATDEA
jgi:hypothetical protein